MNIIPASEWGRETKNPPRMKHAGITEMTVHYTGANKVNRDKDRIANYIKATERYHMGKDPNISAIGYNFAIDKWGRVWELRGWDYQNAANGTASNRTSFSVVCLVGVEDNEPTEEMKKSLSALYSAACRFLNRDSLDVRPHQAHKPTSCPGPQLVSYIESGAIQNKTPVPTIGTKMIIVDWKIDTPDWTAFVYTGTHLAWVVNGVTFDVAMAANPPRVTVTDDQMLGLIRSSATTTDAPWTMPAGSEYRKAWDNSRIR